MADENLNLSSYYNNSFTDKSLSLLSPNISSTSTTSTTLNSTMSSSFYKETSKRRDSSTNRDTSSYDFLVPGENIEKLFLVDTESTSNLDFNIVQSRRNLVDSSIEKQYLESFI